LAYEIAVEIHEVFWGNKLMGSLDSNALNKMNKSTAGWGLKNKTMKTTNKWVQ